MDDSDMELRTTRIETFHQLERNTLRIDLSFINKGRLIKMRWEEGNATFMVTGHEAVREEFDVTDDPHVAFAEMAHYFAELISEDEVVEEEDWIDEMEAEELEALSDADD